MITLGVSLFIFLYNYAINDLDVIIIIRQVCNGAHAFVHMGDKDTSLVPVQMASLYFIVTSSMKDENHVNAHFIAFLKIFILFYVFDHSNKAKVTQRKKSTHC